MPWRPILIAELAPRALRTAARQSLECVGVRPLAPTARGAALTTFRRLLAFRLAGLPFFNVDAGVNVWEGADYVHHVLESLQSLSVPGERIVRIKLAGGREVRSGLVDLAETDETKSAVKKESIVAGILVGEPVPQRLGKARRDLLPEIIVDDRIAHDRHRQRLLVKLLGQRPALR